MAVEIRALRSDEFERFLRFLERCYGLSYNFFPRSYPDLYLKGTQEFDRYLVAVDEGEIVSHVGAYPMPIVAGPAHLKCAGIGGVATSPKARGQGHMTRLMQKTRLLMRERGENVSILWGDRQRYRHFGYETCGIAYELSFTTRSIEHAGVKAVEMREEDPRDPAVVAHVQRFQALRAFRVERPRLDLILAREGVRAFLCEDGYLLARYGSHNLDIHELVSASGNEAGMILGALRLSFGSHASLHVGPKLEESTVRLARAANWWQCESQGMMTVVDWPALAASLRPLLQENAVHARPFSVSIGCKFGEGVDWATLHWDGRSLEVSPDRRGTTQYVLEAGELAATLFGGPMATASLGPVQPLVPVPLHVPKLDHV